MGVESTRQPRSEPYLDGLRAFAVIAVVVVHCWALAGAPTLSILDRDFSFLLGTLGLGFDLFFILSAYLLAKPWFAANLAAMAPPGTRRFWLRRASVVPVTAPKRVRAAARVKRRLVVMTDNSRYQAFREAYCRKVPIGVDRNLNLAARGNGIVTLT